MYRVGESTTDSGTLSNSTSTCCRHDGDRRRCRKTRTTAATATPTTRAPPTAIKVRVTGEVEAEAPFGGDDKSTTAWDGEGRGDVAGLELAAGERATLGLAVTADVGAALGDASTCEGVTVADCTGEAGTAGAEDEGEGGADPDPVAGVGEGMAGGLEEATGVGEAEGEPLGEGPWVALGAGVGLGFRHVAPKNTGADTK